MKYTYLLVILLYSSLSHAQLTNVNPDKNAEPWFVGGLRLPSEEEFNAIPVVDNTFIDKNVDELPSYLDNSTSTYFRSIFSQEDGSCSQASGVGYTFTYEVNRLHNTAANSAANRYPSHYTYNFLNSGSGDNGSWYTDGWDIIRANGCPSVALYGGMSINDRYWMSGYANYEESMSVRVKDYFSIDVGIPEGLETLKYWMYDHLEGADTGGVVNFAAGVSDVFSMTYDNKIIRWGNDVNHAMTIVGWDDSITYDYNGDGNFTNNIDINNDGVVDMRDWEVGALIMVNTWGSYFGNEGKAYIMYKTLAESVGNGGIYQRAVFGIHVEDGASPELTMRVRVNHTSRGMIKIFAGLSTDIESATPTSVVLPPLFSSQGGAYPMRGYGTQDIEISLDISKLLDGISTADPLKFFLVLKESDSDGQAGGTVVDFSIIDKNGTSYMCDLHNTIIENNTFTFLPIVAGLPLGEEVRAFDTIEVYPNPSSNILTINTEERIIMARIFDMSGRLVLSSLEQSINISILKKGIYILQVEGSKHQLYTTEIIKN